VVALGGGSSQSGAAAAVDKFLKAAQNNDANAARDVTCEPLHGQISGSSDAKIKSYHVGKATENGDSARVPFTVVDDQGNETGVATVHKESGTWKVCDITQVGGSGSSAGTDSPSLPSGVPTDLPSGFPTGLPSGLPTGSFCITPPSGLPGATPICIPN
jgi:hypothetical protein